MSHVVSARRHLPGLSPVGLFCSSSSCKQFTILIPAILQLVSKGDTVIVGQSDFSDLADNSWSDLMMTQHGCQRNQNS